MFRVLRISSQHVLPFVLVLMFFTVSSSAQTTLRWKFQEGQVLTQTIVQDVKMSMTIGDRDVATQMKQTINARWSVGKVDAEGAAEVVQDFTRIRMKLDGPTGVGFDFDSNNDEELTGVGAMLAPALRALAKSKFTLKMTPLGEIKNVEVSDETVEAFKQLPAAGQMGGTFSKDGLINLTKQGSHVFPAGPLAKGDTWTTKSELKMPQIGTMVATTKFTCAGPETRDGRPFERVDMVVTSEVSRARVAGVSRSPSSSKMRRGTSSSTTRRAG